MSGHHPFKELTKDFSPERRQRIDSMIQACLPRYPKRTASPRDAGKWPSPERLGNVVWENSSYQDGAVP